MVSKFRKTVIASVVSALLLAPAVPVEAEVFSSSHIYINGIKTEIKDTIVSGKRYLPLKSICEKMNCTVLWNNSEKTITVIKKDKKVEFKLNANIISINGHERYLQDSPEIIKGATYVPMEILSDNLGIDITYVEDSNTLKVSSVVENPVMFSNQREQSKGDVEVDIQYPQISGLNNKKAEEIINSVLKKHVEDFKLVTKDFDKEVKELRKSGFKQSYGVNLNYDVKYNKKDLLSIVFTNYTYTGGAHGSYDNISYTFNLLTGETYSLDDLFSSGSNYEAYINKFIKDKNDKAEVKLGGFESISKDQNYYLSNNGIVIYFDLYQYTPYAAGIPVFTIPYDYDVFPYLYNIDNFTKDYSDLVSNKNLNSIVINALKDQKNEKNLLLDIRYPQLKGLESKQIEAKVNNMIKKYAESYKRTEEDKFRALGNKYESVTGTKYVIGLDYKIKYNYNDVISVVFTEYLYTGGAHGNSSQQAFTINLDSGMEYELKDLFKDGTDYIKELDKLVKQKVGLHEQKASINFESISKSEDYNKNFYLNTDGSVVVFFQHYDIAPYALGILEFEMSNQDIKTIAKDWVIKDI